jgi:hypothetical protein
MKMVFVGVSEKLCTRVMGASGHCVLPLLGLLVVFVYTAENGLAK